MASNAAATTGGKDFHAYWYSGHFVREGLDPYEAFLAGSQPTTPVHYVDGAIASDAPVAIPGFAIAPTNTPVMVLLASLLSHLSWPNAKMVWAMLSIALVMLTAYGVTLLVPPAVPTPIRVALALLYIGFLSTRVAVGNGQTTLLVFALILAALALQQRSKHVLSGVLLGIALSKYSLSLPLLALFLYRRNFLAASIALAVQGASLLLLWAISGSHMEKCFRRGLAGLARRTTIRAARLSLRHNAPQPTEENLPGEVCVGYHSAQRANRMRLWLPEVYTGR